MRFTESVTTLKEIWRRDGSIAPEQQADGDPRTGAPPFVSLSCPACHSTKIAGFTGDQMACVACGHRWPSGRPHAGVDTPRTKPIEVR